MSNCSETHDVVAAIDVNHFAGDGACQAACQIECRPADFQLIDVAVQGSAIAVRFEHLAQSTHSTSSQRLDGTGGDCVDANVLGAQLEREVAHRRFERRFCESHHVVV